MKGGEIEVGTRLWEDCGVGEPYSAGRVVALSECSAKMYVLLEDDDGAYTIYSMERDYNCDPRLTRSVPRENFEYLVRTALTGVELPEEREVPQKKRASAPKDVPKDPQPKQSPATVVNEELDAVESGDPDIVPSDTSDDFSKCIMGFDVTMEVV